MNHDALLAGIAAELNAAPAAGSRVERHAPAVASNNARLRETADRLLAFDASPLSFQALKSEHLPARSRPR